MRESEMELEGEREGWKKKDIEGERWRERGSGKGEMKMERGGEEIGRKSVE